MKFQTTFHLICALTFSLVAGNSTAAKQPETEQPADITRLLAQNPTFSEVQISPDGRYLAATVHKDDKRQLLCMERDGLKTIGGLRLLGKDEVGPFFWANNERLVLKIISRKPWEKEPKYYGELYGVNCDGSNKRMLFGYRVNALNAGARTSAREAWADVIHRLPDDPKNILISSTEWSKSGDKLAMIYKMDIITGQLRKTGRSPIGYADILADKAGIPKVASGTDAEYKQRIYIADDKGEWQESSALNAIGNFQTLRMLPDQSGFYFYGRVGKDLAGLHQYRFADQAITPLYQPETLDVTHAMFSTDGESIYAARMDKDYPSYLLLNKDSEDAQVFKQLTEKFAGADVSLTSRTSDGKLRVFRVEADVQPPVYFLHDQSSQKIMRILDAYPHLRGRQMAQTQPIEFPSADQKLIRGFITLGAPENRPQPLVVLLHGGPYGVRDYWEYNAEVQMLAQSGFNVLQVNFRGSGGYGEAFAEAADKQWGDQVQQDIIAGTRWAIEQGVAESGNICIMGGSFGAYSALQSAALAPELYRCAIGIAGVYDLTLLTKKGDITRLAYGEAYLDKAIGSDEALLKKYSPVYHADKIKADVLLIHGEYDERAPLIHAERMQEALEKAGKKVTLSEYADETHGFYAEENQIKYFKQVKDYLSLQLQR